MTGSAHDHRTAKQRILEAADYLFYNEGILRVAIDRIIADPGRLPTAMRSTTPAAGPFAAAVCRSSWGWRPGIPSSSAARVSTDR